MDSVLHIVKVIHDKSITHMSLANMLNLVAHTRGQISVQPPHLRGPSGKDSLPIEMKGDSDDTMLGL